MVGLALSGGGIRSALVNLGLIQSFEKAGLLRQVDYLSAVSGGSYIGGFLTALICRKGQESTDGADRSSADPAPAIGRAAIDRLELPPEESGRQPPEVTALLRRARYLRRPGEFAARYLLGLAANVLLVAGLLGVFGAGLAYVFRALDAELVASALGHAGRWVGGDGAHAWDPKLGSDVIRAAIPGIVLLSASCALGLICRLCRGLKLSDRLGVAASGVGYMAAVAGVLGLLTLLAGGDVDLGPVEYLFPPGAGDAAVGGPASSRIVASRLPGYEALQAAHLTAILVVAAGVLAMLFFPGRLLQSGHKPGGTWQRKVLDLLLVTLVAGLPMFAFYHFVGENVSGEAPTRRAVAWDRFVAPEIAAGLPVIHSTTRLPEPAGPRDLRYRDAVRRLLSEYSARMAAAAGDLDMIWTGEGVLGDKLAEPRRKRLADNVRKEVGAGASLPSDIEGFLRKQLELEDAGRAKVNALATGNLTGVIQAALLADAGHPAMKSIAAAVTALAKAEDGVRTAASIRGKVDKETAGPVQAYGSWLPEEERTPYRARGAAAYRRTFGEPPAVGLLVDADQRHRRIWFMLSLAAVLTAGLLVNFNGTSMHGYYKDCLSEAFVEPAAGRPRMPLSKLDATAYGGPYLLINATLNLFGRPGLGEDGVPRASAYTFTFSPLHCGSVPTDFFPTEPRERGQAALAERFDDLAEAIAISGAAVSPVGVHSRTLALLMTLANFRLGQWVPRPAAGLLNFRLTPLTVLDDAVQDLLGRDRVHRKHWFVSDGGHNDNLGLWPLLQRRCRLIIVADATMDPKHGFPDFVRICRRARDEAGIRFGGLVDPPAATDVLRPIDLDSLRPLASRDAYDSANPDARLCERHFLLFKAYYPEPGGGCATIVYIKSSLTGDEDADLIAHFREHAAFPHDPTLDQFLEPDEAASYRQLGEHIGRAVTASLPPLLSGAAGGQRPSSRIDDIVSALLKADAGRRNDRPVREGAQAAEPHATPPGGGFHGDEPVTATVAIDHGGDEEHPAVVKPR